MLELKNEISREPPNGFKPRSFKSGEAILYAFECVLLELETKYGYIYTIENLNNGRTNIMGFRKNPLTTQNIEGMVAKIRESPISGAGRYEADRSVGEHINISKAREILSYVFKKVMPKHGYTVRKEQVSLSQHILDAIYRRSISLAEAEVGTGKTYAYLAAAVIAKRGRLNDSWISGLYKTKFKATTQKPIVIATSSIALQQAIITDYIPELSQMLVESGVIKSPLTAVLRKGKENYICERNLREQLLYENNLESKQILKNLLFLRDKIDLAEVDGLTSHIRRKIAVPQRCYDDCPHSDSCLYLKFRKAAQAPSIDIQICNHNYLLADTLRRANDERPLIPDYQILIIDEAHKLLSTARTMYGVELSSLSAPIILSDIVKLKFKSNTTQNIARRDAKKLADISKRLFQQLIKTGKNDNSERFLTEINYENVLRLRGIGKLAGSLIDLIDIEPIESRFVALGTKIKWELSQIRRQAEILIYHNKLICWLETDKKEKCLCAIPKDLNERLFDDQWCKGIPTIFTSGTLSSNAGLSGASDFSHIKRTLGLDRAGLKLTETSKPSPFDYKKNALLYISENVPFPDQRDQKYIDAIADETEKLIRASHGHAAVLFTSYKVMDMVWERIKKRKLPFPLFRLDKGGVQEIERFKKSENGVLFASGALWEGIDIPGDSLSMLIIVKLPFAVPDPISEYEQTLYKDMSEYKSLIIVPEMLIKLKQGFGRLIRTIKDTGVVAILDCRASEKGAYRGSVIRALPKCRVTNKIADVCRFISDCKPAEYFNKKF